MSKIMNHPCRLEQCVQETLSNPSKWTLQGASRAGERTGFYLKEIKCILDCGLATFREPKAIFITHSHTDHTLALPMLICRRNTKHKGQTHLNGTPVYCPKNIMYKIHMLNRVSYELSNDDNNEHRNLSIDELEKRQGYHLFGIGVNLNNYLDIPGIENIKLEILQAYHCNMFGCYDNCVGYGFNRITYKLKDEYNNLHLWKFKTPTL